MPTTRKTKLFKNRARQAMHLPAEYRFAGEEVFATRDDVSGDVLPSTRPGAAAWAEFFALMDTIDIPAEFMIDRPLNVVPLERELFDDAE